MKIQASPGHPVNTADASSGSVSLPPSSADASGVVLGEPESDTAKNIARQLSPS